MEQRLINEIEHGKYLIEKGEGDVWNWESPSGKLRWKRRVEMLTQSINNNSKVLEIGCGSGYFTKEIIKTNADITAIDISPDLIEKAKQTIINEKLSFKVENAYKSTFSDNSFDFVIGSSVLHHLDINLAIKEIYRILKPGGSILFTEPNMLNPQIALQKNIPWLKKKLGDSPDETAFIRFQLKQKLKKNKFKNIQIKPFDFLHPSIPKSMSIKCDVLLRNFERIPLLKEIAGSLYISAKK